MIQIMPRSNLRVSALSALSVAVACGGDTTVTLLPDFDTPAPVVVTILPFNPDALRDSMTAAHAEPRPAFPELETAFRAWQPLDLTDTSETARIWRATRDSVERLADSLRGLDRRSGGYAAAYGRFRGLYQRFGQRTAARDARLRELTADVRDLASRAGRAADSLRRWESAAWAGWDTVFEQALAGTGRDSVTVALVNGDPVGLTLPAGAWWVVARTRIEGNPFLERRWVVGMVTAGLPFRLPLDMRNAHTVWRH